LTKKIKILGKWKYFIVCRPGLPLLDDGEYCKISQLPNLWAFVSTSTFTKAIIGAIFIGLVIVLYQVILFYLLPTLSRLTSSMASFAPRLWARQNPARDRGEEDEVSREKSRQEIEEDDLIEHDNETMKIAAIMALVNVLVERRPKDLKLGYFTVLTIIKERKTRTATMKYFHLPSILSFSSI